MQITNEIENYIENGKLNLERIVKDFTPYIKVIINNIVDNNLSYEDKEEIITDTFFILWKNQNKLTTSVKAYLAGITKNLIKEKLNKKVITYDISDYENSIENCNIEFFKEERKEISEIEKSFEKLKKIDFDIVTMFYYSSKSIKDIAKELNMSEINVKTRLFRIRKKIKKELGVGD